MYEKTIKIFLILLVILFIPIIVQQDSPQPHPDPYSGDLGNYEEQMDYRWQKQNRTQIGL